MNDIGAILLVGAIAIGLAAAIRFTHGTRRRDVQRALAVALIALAAFVLGRLVGC